MCFDDILTLRIYIDATHDLEISACTYNSITSTFDLYIKGNMAFNPRHFDLLKKVTDLEIIRNFFDDFLSAIFGMRPSSRNKKHNKKRKKLDNLALSWLEKLELINYSEQSYSELSVNFK